jgi:hypothetical protein
MRQPDSPLHNLPTKRSTGDADANRLVEHSFR